jgi:anti-sigma factor RsiW
MEDRIEAFTCERGDDLISFLYHELDEREVRDFERHLAACSSCAHELASFKGIRAGVVAWREQTLGLSPISVPERVAFGQPGKPSALAAIRQFFALSRVWLKGAVAFASILFVAAVAFLVMNLNASPVVPVVAVEKRYSESELNAKIEEGVQARFKELNLAPEQSRQQVLAQTPDRVQRAKPKLKSAGFEAKTRRAPLTQSERQQLAADLGLLSSNDDSDLDLWSEQINR